MFDCTRSRSRSPVADAGGELPVDSAIRALPANTSRRLTKLFSDGAMRKTDLDVKSVMILAALQESLQQKVMGHLEAERVFLSNSRSKAGFLVSACEKAKQGALDVRGFGAIDPWKAHLNSKAMGKRTAHSSMAINLENEEEFLDRVGETAKCAITVDCKKDEGAQESNLAMHVPWTTTIGEIKVALSRMGVSLAPNKIKLHDSMLGFLKNKYTLAYYNLSKEATLTLEKRDRGGRKFKKDQSL